MSNVIVNIFKISDLRKRIIFTLAVLVVYRIGAHIPIPGINVDALKQYFMQAQTSGLLDFFDLFSGGAFKRFTIFALGIMPYISASIILDLLKVVFPALERLAKEGHEGQKKISQYTRYLAVFLCAAQAFGLTIWMKSAMRTASGGSVVPEDSGFGFVIIAVVAITTGTMVLVWMGDIITEKGIGNGISLIIMAGIVVRAPQAITATMKKIGDSGEPIIGIILIGLFFIVVAASILLTLGQRRIPVQYGKKQTAQGAMQRSAQYIPLRVNAAGVIPIIFAAAIITFPTQIFHFVGSSNSIMNKIQFWLSPGQIPYIFIYSGLIIFFCFFYTAIRFNPVEIADNLKKYGGFIPGIRPGVSTSDYIMNILNKINLSGSIFLALIAIVPDLILRIWPEQVAVEMAHLFGGTSLLIIVGVALDTLQQIESQLLMRHYDGFLKGARVKGRY